MANAVHQLIRSHITEVFGDNKIADGDLCADGVKI